MKDVIEHIFDQKKLLQRLHDLFFRVVDVAQRVREQVVHCFDVFREEAHQYLLSFRLAVVGCLQLLGARARPNKVASRAPVRFGRQRAKRLPVPQSAVESCRASLELRGSFNSEAHSSMRA